MRLNRGPYGPLSKDNEDILEPGQVQLNGSAFAKLDILVDATSQSKVMLYCRPAYSIHDKDCTVRVQHPLKALLMHKHSPYSNLVSTT